MGQVPTPHEATLFIRPALLGIQLQALPYLQAIPYRM
jgi:hypothetical protein